MTKVKQLITARQRLEDEMHKVKYEAEQAEKYFREQIKRVQANIDYEVSKKHEREG